MVVSFLAVLYSTVAVSARNRGLPAWVTRSSASCLLRGVLTDEFFQVFIGVAGAKRRTTARSVPGQALSFGVLRILGRLGKGGHRKGLGEESDPIPLAVIE